MIKKMHGHAITFFYKILPAFTASKREEKLFKKLINAVINILGNQILVRQRTKVVV